MRIIVSTPTFLPLVGGAELGIHEAYRRLGRNHDVTILTPSLPREVLDKYGAPDYTSDNYNVRHILPELDRISPRIVRRVLGRTSLLYIAELARIVRRERPDVVDFKMIRPHGGALPVMKHVYGIPVVLSLIGRSDVMRLLPAPKRAYAGMLISRADLVVPNSTYYLGMHRKTPKIRIIPSGVDVHEFSPARRSSTLRRELGLSDDHFLLLSVQRLAPIKRVDMIIRAMAEVVKHNRHVVLVIGGQGEEKHRLQLLVSELGLSDNVKFAGYIDSDRLPEYFASSDAFAFHSMIETFGIVFAQAMASGLPIVAANTSCIPDVLTPDNGLFFTPFDTLACADAVLTLANDRPLAKRIGNHNRVRAVREFDWDLIAIRYEQMLKDAIAGDVGYDKN
jgi:glycosyltransferase involved in cell wall biosynthesis